MLWIFLAISAHFFWALQNIGDKYILGNKIKNPYVYLVWFSLTGIFVLVVIPFISLDLPSGSIWLWLILASAVYFYGGMPYVKAMQIEEPTRINVWWNLIPLFSLLIGWSLFDEKFTVLQLVAFAVLLTGAVIASIHARGKKIVFSKAVWYMVVSSLCFAVYGVLFHHIMNSISFLSGFVCTHLFMSGFATTLLLSKGFRRDFVRESKSLNKYLLIVILLITLVGHLGALFNQWALSFSSAALVFAMEGSQVIFVFVMATLISFFAPKILKEELDKRNMLLKLVAIVLMIAGILVLVLN